MKQFDTWNEEKKHVEAKKVSPQFKEREIFLTSYGENVGFEQCGKNSGFVRPVVIIRKFNKHMSWCIPLSTTKRRGKYYYPFCFTKQKESVALLSQLKLIDAKRLQRKIGMMNREDFEKMSKKITELLPGQFPPAEAGVVPKEFVTKVYKNTDYKSRICLLAHNIRSLWNVGSFFRTADTFGVEKIFLTGYTATPPRREISKTAIGAEEWIDWEYDENPKEVIRKLKMRNWKLVGLEITEGAFAVNEYKPSEKTCLIVGHEVTGIPEDLLKLCDDIIYIPMHGKKESLNVSVATGIALNQLRNCLNHDLPD